MLIPLFSPHLSLRPFETEKKNSRRRVHKISGKVCARRVHMAGHLIFSLPRLQSNILLAGGLFFPLEIRHWITHTSSAG
jgi:hypothetical protein